MKVSFDWRRQEFPARNFPERGRIGFIAQDLEEVVPEVVSTDNEVSAVRSTNSLIA